MKFRSKKVNGKKVDSKHLQKLIFYQQLTKLELVPKIWGIIAQNQQLYYTHNNSTYLMTRLQSKQVNSMKMLILKDDLLLTKNSLCDEIVLWNPKFWDFHNATTILELSSTLENHGTFF